MKTYSDLTDIDHRLQIRLLLEPVGTPEISVMTPGGFSYCKLFKPATIETQADLLNPFSISVELKNKIYSPDHETAVIIKSLQIDDIELVPRFDYLATYKNDNDHAGPTSYLGFNGCWTLTIDRPFYQWLHQATAQGWLIS